MNNLSCIGINFDQLRKEVVVIKNALANGYKDNCYTKKEVAKDYFYNLPWGKKNLQTTTKKQN